MEDESSNIPYLSEYVLPKRYKREIEDTSVLMRKGEMQYYGTAIASGLTPANGSTGAAFLAMPQGTASNRRVGQEIYLWSLEVRGYSWIQNEPVTDNASDIFRIVWVLDTQANGAAPSVTDILESATILSPFNDFTVPNRFSVFYDKMFIHNVEAAFTWRDFDNNNTHHNNYRKFRDISFCHDFPSPIKIQYKGNAGTVVDMASNNLVILVIGLNANIVYNASVRVCFTDK